MVSIITPAYNSAAYISEAIESVLAQTFPQWEMWIVDDCSIDNTAQIVESYSQKDSRIKLEKLSQNVGPAEARNIAIRRAQGRYIAFLDSDDLWHPAKLEKQLNFIKNTGYAFIFSNYLRIKGKEGKRLNEIIVPYSIDYRMFLRNTIIGTLTVLIDRDKIGYFEMPNVRSSHDMALWCELLKRGFKAYGIREVLAYYRVHEGSNTANKIKASRDVWKVYRKVEGLVFFTSLINFVFYAMNAVRKRIYYKNPLGIIKPVKN
ncbi:MAG: glycosyltransferase family 2 protein [bacterium]